jgi:hypothetical protein
MESACSDTASNCAGSPPRSAARCIPASPHRSASLVPRDSDRRSRFLSGPRRPHGRDRLTGRTVVGGRCPRRCSVAGARPVGQPSVERRHCSRPPTRPIAGLCVPKTGRATVGELSRTGCPGRPAGRTHLNSFDPGRSRDGRAIEPLLANRAAARGHRRCTGSGRPRSGFQRPVPVSPCGPCVARTSWRAQPPVGRAGITRRAWLPPRPT